METVNVRKSRKIAQMIRRLIGDLRKEKTISVDVAKDAFDMIDDLAKELLITPPRNCDVGTADEQMKRQHDTMCNTTKACPDSEWSCRKCFAEYSQMPYKEGGGK